MFFHHETGVCENRSQSSGRAKDMLQPGLIHLHLISLVPLIDGIGVGQAAAARVQA